MREHIRGQVCKGAGVSIRPPALPAIQAALEGTQGEGMAREWLPELLARPDVRYFSIHEAERLVGHIYLHDLDPGVGESLIGYELFSPADRGRGIGTRALELLVRWVEDATDLARLVIITSGDNAASRRIAEKNGFVFDGPPREDPTGVVLALDISR